MVEIVLFTVLALAGAAFILHPLFFMRGRSAMSPATGAEENREWELLLAEKEVIYADLKDIEFEFETGKLSEEDYAELRQAYRVRALDVLERIGASTASLEGERRNGRHSPDECRSCGAEFEADSRFCRVCGGPRSEAPPAALS
jgi:rRNA maturation endonuclease Nob1